MGSDQAGKICYLELPATDVARSAEFYRSLFGWSIRKRGDGATAFDDTTGAVSGAWVTNRPPMRDAGLLVYIMVSDAAASCAAIEQAGGRIIKKLDPAAPEVYAHFADPAGNVLGIYQEGGP